MKWGVVFFSCFKANCPSEGVINWSPTTNGDSSRVFTQTKLIWPCQDLNLRPHKQHNIFWQIKLSILGLAYQQIHLVLSTTIIIGSHTLGYVPTEYHTKVMLTFHVVPSLNFNRNRLVYCHWRKHASKINKPH